MEKAFDSVEPNFIQWIRVLLNKQVSCVMNNGFTTGYFTNERGTRQGDPISAYLFILVLEILFLQGKENEKIKVIKISSHEFLLSAFADDATYLVCNMDSIKELFRLHNEFEQFSTPKANREETVICGIGSLKGANRAFCGCKSVNLLNNNVTILGVAHSYNSNAADHQNFVNLLDKTESILNIWNMIYLSLLGRVQILKTFAISKLNYLASVSNIPKSVVDQLTVMQKQFIWNNKPPKIKHSTLIAPYSKGGLNNVDVECRLRSLQLLWMVKLSLNKAKSYQKFGFKAVIYFFLLKGITVLNSQR